MLTNSEVMTILQSSWEEKKKGKGLKNLATICYETLQYLTECPAPIKFQTNLKIIEYRNEMRKFKLTENEIFTMVNDPPTSLLHIQLLIEDSEERLTEDQVTEILQITERLLIPPPVQETSTDPDTSAENGDKEEDEIKNSDQVGDT